MTAAVSTIGLNWRIRGSIRRRPRPREESSGLDVNGAHFSTSMAGVRRGFLKISDKIFFNVIYFSGIIVLQEAIPLIVGLLAN